MPRSVRIYTKKGDRGQTSLGSRKRVHKGDLRVETYGTVDELNSAVGMAAALGVNRAIQPDLKQIQDDLLDLGADLAFPLEDTSGVSIPRIGQAEIVRLEGWIDRMQSELPPLKNFILPGGTPSAAALHLARTICRRAERSVSRLSSAEPVGESVIPYLNRLSDCLFVMARYENFLNNQPDLVWKAGN